MTEDLEKTEERIDAARAVLEADEELEDVLVTEDGKVFLNTDEGRLDCQNYLNRRPEVIEVTEEILNKVAVVTREDLVEEE